MRISDWSSDVCSSDLLSKIGEAFLAAIAPILESVGPLPHARLDTDARSTAPKKTKTRMLKRSEERREGQEGVSTYRYWRSPFHQKKKQRKIVQIMTHTQQQNKLTNH